MHLDAISATYLAGVLVSLALIRVVLTVRNNSTPSPPGGSLENQLYGLLIGCIMFGIGSWQITGSASDLARYNGDPSCGGFGVSIRGACRLTRATIVDASKVTYRSSVTYSLTFQAADGTYSTVTLNKDRRGDVWEGAKDYSDRAATVQYFGNDPTLIWTSSGIAETDKLPAFSVKLWLVVSLIGLLIVAIDLCLMSFKLFKPSVSIEPPIQYSTFSTTEK